MKAKATKCVECGGAGRRLYASTSTWHGGMGGSAMTTDTCDLCWGSGDAANPGPDLRKPREAAEEEAG